jgi:CDP-glycerol glycerophosphotransferase (TagB/SpsB family)
MNIIYGEYVLGYDIEELKNILTDFKFYSYISASSILNKITKIWRPYFKSLLGERSIHIFEVYNRLVKFKLKNNINVFINHGWGVKMSPGIPSLKSKKKLKAWRSLRKFTDYIICYSEFDETYFLNNEYLNDLRLPKFIPIGHPRNDLLIKMQKKKEYVYFLKNKYNLLKYGKIYLFAPTHRETYLFNYEFDKKIARLYLEELEGIDKFCKERNCVILYRPHYMIDNVNNIHFNNVRVISPKLEKDPRPFMLVSDFLITDYSSIYVDYLLLNKPIIFYQPDLELYKNIIRGLVVDENNKIHMPGPKLKNLKEIFELDEKDFDNYDLESSRRFFHKYYDGRSLERLANFIKKIKFGSENF